MPNLHDARRSNAGHRNADDSFFHLDTDLPTEDYPHADVVDSPDQHQMPTQPAARLNYTSMALGFLLAAAFLAWAFRSAWLVGCAQ